MSINILKKETMQTNTPQQEQLTTAQYETSIIKITCPVGLDTTAGNSEITRFPELGSTVCDSSIFARLTLFAQTPAPSATSLSKNRTLTRKNAHFHTLPHSKARLAIHTNHAVRKEFTFHLQKSPILGLSLLKIFSFLPNIDSIPYSNWKQKQRFAQTRLFADVVELTENPDKEKTHVQREWSKRLKFSIKPFRSTLENTILDRNWISKILRLSLVRERVESDVKRNSRLAESSAKFE